MLRLPPRRLDLPALVCLAVFLTILPLGAQTIRPTGNTSRTGTTGASSANRAGTNRSGGSSIGSSSSASGRSYHSNTQLGDAIIQIDPETRTIIVVTDEETHEQLNKVIQDLDRPKPQVLIKVVFLEVTYNKGADLGVEGSYTFNLKNPVAAMAAGTNTTTTNTTANTTGGFSGNVITGTTSTNSVATNPTAATAAAAGSSVGLQSLFGLSTATAGSFVRVAGDNWNATLHALAQRGKVEVLSRPSIMARNNQEAVIVVGQEVPFVTNSRTDSLGNLTNTIQYDNVGIILRVTPFITSKNSVEMIVAPEISALTAQTVPISNNASAPVISKRSAETVVVTPNGTTAVIGGLMQTQRLSNIDKIPILGDIPLLGAAFRHTVTNDVKTELLIFLTPTIISTPDQLDTSTTENTQDTELVKQAFTESEFDKFFDTLPVKQPDTPVIPALEKQNKKSAAQRVPATKPKPTPKKVPKSEDPAIQPAT